MKQIISNYTYNTTSKTVTLTDFTTVRLDRLQLITNTTTNAIIYNFADSTVATASVATNVITLSAAPGSNTDKLMIIYDCLSGDPVYDGYKELAGLTAGALNADLVPSTDVSAYKWFSIQVTGTWAGTLTFQGSNDNTNWNNLPVQNQATVTGSQLNVATSNNGYHGALVYRYFRIRMTAYTSGTAVGTAELYTNVGAYQGMGVAASQSGTWSVGANSATGSAVPANAFYMAGSNAADSTLRGVTAVPYNIGDALSTGAVALASYSPLYNGTNLERPRNATSASGTTGTGVPAAGMLGFDGTNYQRVATDTSGFVKVLGSSATGSAAPANAFYISANNASGNLTGLTTASAQGDGIAGGSALGTSQIVYNGATYDRNRSNEAVTVLASSARTTTQTSADLVNYNGASFLDVILDTTVASTGSVTLTINGKDPASGKYYNLLSGVAVVAVSTNVYRVGVGLTAAANAIANLPIPRIFQIVVTANNANTQTYSVGYNLVR